MNPATDRTHSWLHHILRQLAIVAGITLIVSTGLVIVFGQSWRPTLIYSAFISVSCALCVQGLRYGCGWLLAQRRGPDARASDWPGWPAMIFSLVAGTWIGYTLGNELANLVTGHQSAGLHNSTLRRALTIMLISLLPGFALTFYYVGRGRIEAAEARAQTLQRQAAEAQLRLLEAQLEPHMLFNTLANLRVLISLDPQRAQDMLDHLIAFLRATLSASRVGSHTLAEEFARLKDYLALMQVRMGARLRPQLDLPPELAGLTLPPLLLQPLVENAIKHGLEPHVEGGELRISATLQQDQLVLRVRDTGAGFHPGGAGTGTQFGLDQVRARLAAQYGPKARFEIGAADDAQGGTLACITLPRLLAAPAHESTP